MMNQYDDKDFDVVIIGGGPSGMAAAAQAAKYQLKVALIDDRPTLGGQIYKQFGIGFKVKNPRKLGSDYLRGQELVAATDSPYIRILSNTTAAAIEDFSVHIVSQGEKARTITFKKLIVSPGAHDRPVVFPGWTLPGVITAGGDEQILQQFILVLSLGGDERGDQQHEHEADDPGEGREERSGDGRAEHCQTRSSECGVRNGRKPVFYSALRIPHSALSEAQSRGFTQYSVNSASGEPGSARQSYL